MAVSRLDEQRLIERTNWWDSPALIGFLVVAVIIGIVGFASYYFLRGGQDEKAEAAQDLYTKATTPAEKFIVAKNNLNSPISALWLMEVGSTFYLKKSYDLSVEAYQLVVQNQPHSPLVPGALLGEAEALMAQNKGSEAVPLITQVLQGKEKNAYQPLARLVLARWQISQNQPTEARHTLEDLQAQSPDSSFSQETSELLSSLP